MAVASNAGFSVKENFTVDDHSFELKDVNKGKLVLLVFQRANLWKVDSQEFSQKALVEQSWRQITVELGLSVEYWEHIKRKWKTVKDEYVKWHRYCNNPPPDGIKVRKRAYKPLFQSMEFLDPYLRHRNVGTASRPPSAKAAKGNTISNGHASIVNKLNSQVETAAAMADLNSSLVQRRTTSKLNDPAPTSLTITGKAPTAVKDEPPTKKRAKENGDVAASFQKAMAGHDIVLNKIGSDGVRHFLEDVSVTLLKLPENKLQYAKMKIQLFLYNLQYGTSDIIEAQDNLD